MHLMIKTSEEIFLSQNYVHKPHYFANVCVFLNTLKVLPIFSQYIVSAVLDLYILQQYKRVEIPQVGSVNSRANLYRYLDKKVRPNTRTFF